MADEPTAGSGTPAAGDPPAGSPPAPAAGNAPAAGDPPAAQAGEGAGAAPTAETKYELKLPEGSTLDAAVLERTAATARELGLSQEHAQKMSDLVAAEIASREVALLAQYKPGGEAWGKQIDRWEAEALADTEIGGTKEKLAENTELAKKVIGTFGDKAIFDFLNDTGFGSSAAVIRMLSKIGRAMSEQSLVKGGPSGTKSLEELFYGSQQTEQSQS